MIRFVYSMYHYTWALVSAIFFGFPSRKIRVIGVTGTKGKSTTVALLAHVLAYAGNKVAYLSTVSVQDGTGEHKNITGNSMPGRFYIQQWLRRAVKNECSYAVLEVTSQGAMQHRHRFIQWAGAVFLDIHPEHIESHGSFEKYLQAKLSFFAYARRWSRRVVFYINKDDAHADDFIHAAGTIQKKILFSPDDLFDVPEIPSLPGAFNKINIAATYAVAHEEGLSYEIIHSGFLSFTGVAGRMEFIVREPFEVVVDYAHTPDSLEAVYSFLRARAHERGGKLIGVLGSAGGGRDVWKRPQMGTLAGDFCDLVILTNEDPFDENPMDIIRAVHEGVQQSDQYNEENVFIIEDRQEGITKALSLAQAGDVVVCTGKGSENSIRIAHGKKIPWSERSAVECALVAQRGQTQN